MNDVFDFPDTDCSRARNSMAEFVDGDLAFEQAAWLRKHLQGCEECHAALSRFQQIDADLMAWGRRLDCENPPPAFERLELAARMLPPASFKSRPRSLKWVPVAALAAAAAIALAVFLPLKKPLAPDQAGLAAETHFVEIPYLASVDPQENSTIVRMDISVATLLAVGYRVAADPDTIVPADVLVGEDGRAHAVHVLSGIALNGMGD